MHSGALWVLMLASMALLLSATMTSCMLSAMLTPSSIPIPKPMLMPSPMRLLMPTSMPVLIHLSMPFSIPPCMCDARGMCLPGWGRGLCLGGWALQHAATEQPMPVTVASAAASDGGGAAVISGGAAVSVAASVAAADGVDGDGNATVGTVATTVAEAADMNVLCENEIGTGECDDTGECDVAATAPAAVAAATGASAAAPPAAVTVVSSEDAEYVRVFGGMEIGMDGSDATCTIEGGELSAGAAFPCVTSRRCQNPNH
ncbi:unnamed protein product [Closterium sp. NIES-54]